MEGAAKDSGSKGSTSAVLLAGVVWLYKARLELTSLPPPHDFSLVPEFDPHVLILSKVQEQDVFAMKTLTFL